MCVSVCIYVLWSRNINVLQSQRFAVAPFCSRNVLQSQRFLWSSLTFLQSGSVFQRFLFSTLFSSFVHLPSWVFYSLLLFSVTMPEHRCQGSADKPCYFWMPDWDYRVLCLTCRNCTCVDLSLVKPCTLVESYLRIGPAFQLNHSKGLYSHFSIPARWSSFTAKP